MFFPFADDFYFRNWGKIPDDENGLATFRRKGEKKLRTCFRSEVKFQVLSFFSQNNNDLESIPGVSDFDE